MSTLTAQLNSLWSSSAEPPDIVYWWSSVMTDQTAFTADEVLSALLMDQSHRWRSPEPLTAEGYLARLGSLPAGIDWCLELAVGEFAARAGTSHAADIDEFITRFPAISETLRTRLLQLSGGVLSTNIVTDVVRITDDVLNDRYRLDRLLGQGQFGKVFLAWDLELQRDVAIKLPTDARMQDPRHAEDYLREARTLAGLDHPGILPVYDVGRTSDRKLYVVSRFVDGNTLGVLLKQKRPDFETVARILIPIAEALAFAHERKILHRDVKPDNILIEAASGRPFLADFGLAIREQDYRERPSVAGTPAYMSPEQVRGEGHRLDGRSDLFSLGVILYEMLTGHRPFNASARDQLFQQIIASEPTAPRLHDPSIPAELESICLKTIAKRSSDRFETAGVFAEALTQCLKRGRVPSLAVSTAVVQPRGLRSFDADDSDAFLQLLPGLKNPAGLPESLAFWKEQIEQPDAGCTFTVGLIYGPSGCGKSSLVKAGLIPRLSKEIRIAYLEATASGTEDALSRILQKLRPDLSGLRHLVEILTAIRRGSGPKVVIFLDQFEQWLHRNPAAPENALVAALRQCDGARLQVVLMVRDDFYVSVSRFMQQLDVDILQRKNCAMVDLFDLRHAANVLQKFGTFYGRLPTPPAELSLPQQDFLREVVQSLAEDNQVISVRLALFAEMVRDREWTLETLQEIGGADGVGVAFLEQTFSSARSDVRYRRHQVAVRGILKTLLPGLDTEIKGCSRTSHDLQIAAGYIDRDEDFREVIRILDTELRLITPTEGVALDSGAEVADSTAGESTARYQLSHDYLVPALREWLTRKQKETPKGRAELALEERCRTWSVRREARSLPSLTEYFQICWYLRRQHKTPPQQQLLQAALRLHTFRSGIGLLLLTVVLVGAYWLRQQAENARAESLASSIAQTKTSELAAGLVPLQLLREYALPTLQKLYMESEQISEARLHLAIARLQLGDTDADLLPAARDRALECRPEQLFPLTKLLQPWAATLQPELRQITEDQQQPATARLHAACLLAAWEPADGPDTAWSQPATAEFIAAQLAAQNPVFVGAYQEVLRPQAGRLTVPLATLFADPAQTEVARTIVTGLLADYAKDNVPVLAQALLTADPAADKLLFPLLESDRPGAITEFQAVLQQQLTTDWNDPPLNPAWSVPAAALQAQVTAAHGMIAERFAFCMDMPLPELLEVVAALKPAGYRPTRLRPVAGTTDQAQRMSAVWIRDGGQFSVHPGVQHEELPKPDQNAIRDGLLLADLAFVPGSGPQSGWLTLWSEPDVQGEERRCLAGVDETRLQSGILKGEGSELEKLFQLTLNVHNDAEGNRLYSAVYSTAGTMSEALPSWPGHDRLDLVQRDVAAAAPAKLQLPDPRAGFRKQLEQIAALPAEQLDQPKIRFARATALYQTDQLEATLTDLDWLSQKLSTPDVTVLQYRSLALARLQRQEEAAKVFAAFLQTSPGASLADYVAIQMLAAGKDPAAVITALDAATLRHGGSVDDLYNIACAAALSSRIFGELGVPEGATQLREQAIKLLTACITRGYSNGNHVSSDADFAELHADDRFLSLVSRLLPVFPADRAAAVWNADPTLETMQLRAKCATDLRSEVDKLLADSWRPVSVVLEAAGGDQSAILLLQRPLIADARREALAIRQGAAAVALLRLGAAVNVWPLLESRPDPRLRSEILHRLSLYSVDGRALMTQLTAESGSAEPAIISRRRSLIQGLGELAAAKLLPPPLVADATADLLLRFAQDPDSGVHGMCEWTLRQLGAAEQMLQTEQKFRTGDAVDGRRWYLTKAGGNDPADRGLSFAIIDATEPFVMGSPLSEAERFSGPAGQNERRHRRQIGRVVAIGMHEVTVSQFLKFRRQHEFNASYSPTADSPMNSVKWYDAAAFCNWLSEQEGLDSSQWCYERGEQDYAAGMRIKPNFTELQGYRLPTEAEWERVCRDDTSTSRYFGETDRLLKTYACYTPWDTKPGDKSMQPVSTLRPNGAGAFGLYGNALEWCMDVQQLYSSEVSVSPDLGQGGQVSDLEDFSRVLRGGSFYNIDTYMRSANRSVFRPGVRYFHNGFRVSRTYYLRP